MLAANSAGSGLPDVGRLGDVGQAANVGFVKKLDSLVDPAWKASIVDVAWADVSFPREGEKDSHIWAIPKMLATEVWFYNKTMFRKAGLDPDKPPQTLEEFQKAAKALTQDTEWRRQSGPMGCKPDRRRGRRSLAPIHQSRQELWRATGEDAALRRQRPG